MQFEQNYKIAFALVLIRLLIWHGNNNNNGRIDRYILTRPLLTTIKQTSQIRFLWLSVWLYSSAALHWLAATIKQTVTHWMCSTIMWFHFQRVLKRCSETAQTKRKIVCECEMWWENDEKRRIKEHVAKLIFFLSHFALSIQLVESDDANATLIVIVVSIAYSIHVSIVERYRNIYRRYVHVIRDGAVHIWMSSMAPVHFSFVLSSSLIFNGRPYDFDVPLFHSHHSTINII